MKNIILQHFQPHEKYLGQDSHPIVEKSVANIEKYAKSLGAEYKLLDGKPFMEDLRMQCQKLAMLNEEYDEYDTVVMLDSDMFVRKGMTENVFEAKGVACYDDVHKNRQHPAFVQLFPGFTSRDVQLWSGACYVLPREVRQAFRTQINPVTRAMMRQISPHPYVEEGIMHMLAVHGNLGYSIYDKCLDEKWCYSHYLPNVENCYMIHIRKKPYDDSQGVYGAKMKNYEKLVERGLIEP